MTKQPPPKTFPNIQGRCPACRGDSLFVGSGGWITCSRIDCPNPSAADQMLHGELQIPRPAAAEATEAAEEQPLAVPRYAAAALHEALGQLLGEEGAQAIGRVRALHHDWEADPGHCAHCTGPDGNLVRFPCDTVRALDGEEQPSV